MSVHTSLAENSRRAVDSAPVWSNADEVPTPVYRDAMRHLPGGVSVITVGRGEERTGFTATSVCSLSIEPPTLLVTVNRSSSTYPALAGASAFGVNLLSAHHRGVAERFSGREGIKGPERYADARWTPLVTGVALLADAVVAFDCVIEELLERHSHAIVIGRVVGVRANGAASSLVYWRGAYDHLGWTDTEISRAVGLAPFEP
jgi:flavin reductase (DIM6/NTAB) family NADH-FMN oxidoreductase RutF